MFVCQTLFSHSKLYGIRSSFFRTWLADSVQFKQNGLSRHSSLGNVEETWALKARKRFSLLLCL